MFSLMRMPNGNALLICVRDGSVAGKIDGKQVEGVSQALGLGIPVEGEGELCGECLYRDPEDTDYCNLYDAQTCGVRCRRCLAYGESPWRLQDARKIEARAEVTE